MMIRSLLSGLLISLLSVSGHASVFDFSWTDSSTNSAITGGSITTDGSGLITGVTGTLKWYGGSEGSIHRFNNIGGNYYLGPTATTNPFFSNGPLRYFEATGYCCYTFSLTWSGSGNYYTLSRGDPLPPTGIAISGPVGSIAVPEIDGSVLPRAAFVTVGLFWLFKSRQRRLRLVEG